MLELGTSVPSLAAHPKIVTFAIGFGITMAIGTAIGMLDHSHMANAFITQHNCADQSRRCAD
jgi:hypothetical protein